jgi:hypothetical protein
MIALATSTGWVIACGESMTRVLSTLGSWVTVRIASR